MFDLNGITMDYVKLEKDFEGVTYTGQKVKVKGEREKNVND